MKLDSKYFDSIRVSSRRSAGAKKETRAPLCQWKGCDKPGNHKAPKGRGRDNEYFHFCMDHVRQYNQDYNYFDGMSDAEVSNFRKDALTGHRPTWKTGANAWAHGTRDGARTEEAAERVAASTARMTRKARSSRTQPATFRRQLKPLERKSLKVLDLGDDASREDIKTRFKELVKIHHPDANGGDSRSEEKLREILQAYNYLKQAGLA
jgi:curved DNA-binding protein CbpA